MQKPVEVPEYSRFADIYDSVMTHIDYGQWAEFILAGVSPFCEQPPSPILDLACGSGQLLRKLQMRTRAHFFGLDRSEAMLETAKSLTLGKAELTAGSLTDLPYNDNQFALVTCTHDSVNYLTDIKDLARHYQQVARVLKPGGLYWCDLTSEENILKFFHKKTQKVKHGDWQLKWTNTYSRKSHIIESILEFKNKVTGEVNVENHYQRFYPPEQVQKIAAQFGLEVITRFTDYEPKYEPKGASLIILLFRLTK